MAWHLLSLARQSCHLLITTSLSIERLQRLYKATPSPVVHFLAGSLPASALLHLRQFSLLGMIARLGPTNILHQHGCSILADISSNKFSWFYQVSDLCKQYSLPDPLHVLHHPPSKLSFKRQAKLRVLDWWNTKYRAEVASLPSLSMFRAECMSLANPHPIWTSAGSSPYEIRKATVQARMLSGRYRTCYIHPPLVTANEVSAFTASKQGKASLVSSV